MRHTIVTWVSLTLASAAVASGPAKAGGAAHGTDPATQPQAANPGDGGQNSGQDLSAALKAFAARHHVELLYSQKLLTDKKCPATQADAPVNSAKSVKGATGGKGGKHTAPAPGRQEAELEALLAGTGLTYQYLDPNKKILTLVEIPKVVVPVAAATANAPVTTHIGPVTDAAALALPEPAGPLTEVLVTAEKRTENLQDVPVAVTAVEGQDLLDANEVHLKDYAARIPGLSVATNAMGAPLLSIRGVGSLSNANPGVGLYIDETPVSSPMLFGGGGFALDLDPGDLERLEVLRGPQGTLYGANSIGGLVKLVTRDPVLDQLSARIETAVTDVYNAVDPGYSARGAVNLPLGDTFAIRASGYTRREPGYIDNLVTGRDGANEEVTYGGRLAALWRPEEGVSVKFGAIFQHDVLDGAPSVDSTSAGLSNLTQSIVAGGGGFDRSTQSYSAVANLKMADGLDFTSATGLTIQELATHVDDSQLLNYGSDRLFGTPGAVQSVTYSNQIFSQEFRLSGHLDTWADWLAGAFYQHDSDSAHTEVNAVTPATGALAGQWLNGLQPGTYQELAGFGDLTLHLTRRFDLQLGARQSDIHQSSSLTDTGPYVPAILGADSPLEIRKMREEEHPFTYLLTPKLAVSEDLMLYGRLATGYRPGGANAPSGASVPSTFRSDETRTYELGVKSELFERTLQLDAALYDINWRSVQILLTNPESALPYFSNAGRAVSRGAEGSIDFKPYTYGPKLSAWASYTDAHLTQDLPAEAQAFGRSGDELPKVPKFSGAISVDQAWAVGEVTGAVGATLSYTGDRTGPFLPMAGMRAVYPAYSLFSLHADVERGGWRLNIAGTNLGNRRAVSYGGAGTEDPNQLEILAPRAVQLSISKQF